MARQCTEKTQNMQVKNSLAMQWLVLCVFTAMGPGSVPGRGTKIPQAAWHGQKTKRKTSKQNIRANYWN